MLNLKQTGLGDKREVTREKRIGNENSDEEDDDVQIGKQYKLDGVQENVSSEHLNDHRLAAINPLWSGIAFYVDLHAHAAKRGKSLI